MSHSSHPLDDCDAHQITKKKGIRVSECLLVYEEVSSLEAGSTCGGAWIFKNRWGDEHKNLLSVAGLGLLREQVTNDREIGKQWNACFVLIFTVGDESAEDHRLTRLQTSERRQELGASFKRWRRANARNHTEGRELRRQEHADSAIAVDVRLNLKSTLDWNLNRQRLRKGPECCNNLLVDKDRGCQRSKYRCRLVVTRRNHWSLQDIRCVLRRRGT